MIEYVLICTIFGAAAAVVSHTKARNALGWFIVGFLLGPFGLIVAVLPPALKEGYTKQCPQCFEVIKDRAQLCKHCRSPAESHY